MFEQIFESSIKLVLPKIKKYVYSEASFINCSREQGKKRINGDTYKPNSQSTNIFIITNGKK